MENAEKKLCAGYAKVKVTPPMGHFVPGYFAQRYADGIITDLFVRGVAFSDGSKKAVILCVDCLTLSKAAADVISQMVAKRCNMDVDGVYVTCIHSHTAFRVTEVTEENNNNDVFHRWFYQQMTDCAQFAFEDLKPCTLKAAAGNAKNVGFIRTYRMKNGEVRTNPGIGNPDVVGPIAEQDEQVQLLRVVREGGKELLLVNFATHADVIGGTKFCADWPGFLADILENAFDGQVEAVTLVGTEGNSNHINIFQPKGTPSKGVGVSKRMARILAGEVLKIYDAAKDVNSEGVSFCRQEVVIGQNPHDPADEPVAKEIYDLYKKLGNGNDPVFKNYTMSVPEAVRIASNLSRPDTFHIFVSGLRIGGVAFVGMPGEPFCIVGQSVKKASAMEMTMVTCLTNGSHGYFPDAAAFAEKGYERSSSIFAHNCAQLLVEGGNAVTQKMKQEL